MEKRDTDMKEVRYALEAHSEWHCPAIKCSGRQWQSSNINIHLIWTGSLPALHRQSFSPRSSLEDHVPLNPHFFLSLSSCFYLYISFSLITNCTAHSKLLTMTQKRGGEWIKRVKNSRKPRDTQSCLRVVVMFPPHPLGSIVPNCNRTSGRKIKSLFCYQNTETWPWVSKASEQNRIVIE